MCYPLHVAVNVCTDCSVFYIYCESKRVLYCRFYKHVTFVIGGCLSLRCHDVSATVRRDAVIATVNILKSSAVDATKKSTLVDCVKERLCDIQVI